MTADLDNLKSQLQSLADRAARSVADVQTAEQLESVRVEYLGKKGVLSQILGAMGKLSADERPQVGAIANQIKQSLQNQLDDRKLALQKAEINRRLESETLDVTMPGVIHALQGRVHPIQGTIDRALDILVGLGFTVAQGPEIETDYYNFESLNTPADHPARDMQDTLYLTDGKLLRTQTSSVQIRYMEANEPPLRIACPGRVYRKDDIDATHSPVFHQIELLAVEEGLTFGDLKGTVKTFVEELFGEQEVRFRPSYFPFTEPSAEVDVKWNGRWLELGGCGMVDPNVFKAVGYDSEVLTGFAWGFGIERIAMVMHQIDDIRRLFSSDLRFLQQF
ncbi:MAG: phenylalanine--tRNA ligase subunit alpha [Pseudanabaena sp. RU_4_16]|nr:phenylalanine--tRNA ligase subunit alpha [Pseudanabaena sp. SU_2_4]NJM27945.1 phenylalanine--tRNA ligase subunit alpha [Pseudanabaena sp. RU_4_16]NKB17021.1 phenylalanine--tRNA ligase subunit alpha [Pseudanabaena sp. CRU_2_10]